MAGGEVCFAVFTKSQDKRASLPTKTDVGVSGIKECCIQVKALAETSGSDIYKNDIHAILEFYDKNFYTDVTIFIQKLESGVWVDKVELIDNTYGVNRAYGFAVSSNGLNNFVGYNLRWQDVLNGFGDGTYRFRFKEIDFDANETESFYPIEFCLKEYTPNRANNSVRFDYYLKGFLGDFSNDQVIWDYTNVADENGWRNQLRLDGLFGYNKSEYEREHVRYTNGQQVYLKNEQVESYTYFSGYLSATLHDYVKTNILQADVISVTDYNKNNQNTITDQLVNFNSNYEPRWTRGRLNAPVNVDFVQSYQNRIKKRC